MKLLRLAVIVLSFLLTSVSFSQHSVAREWNEVLLDAIRNDYARPTVHARNLFHTSAIMYDSWAVFDTNAQTYFLGKNNHGYVIPFDGFTSQKVDSVAIKEVLSYACYRLLKYRFRNSPGKDVSYPLMDDLLMDLGYDSSFHSLDYTSGNPAALGNYLAEQVIRYGKYDRSNDTNDYANLYYEPLNDPLIMDFAGNSTISDMNRWQPLALEFFKDQSGNVFPKGTPDFLSPEWGKVHGFALDEEDLSIKTRDGHEYWVYHDPGAPALMQDGTDESSENYRWGFDLVSIWSSHLDPSDGVMIDISPASFGNIQNYPTTHSALTDFYKELEGGDIGMGRNENPYTGEAYEVQEVPRGDYTRVLAEFWTDGPDSETPPGHWFTILNYVSDHALFEKRFEGQGDLLDDLEWDVKSYFMLGGAVHDAAITAWGIKGYYDFIRPVCALRAMADYGQSSDENELSYHPKGVALVPGYIEVVKSGDSLAGDNDENVGKIKVMAWKGPDYIDDPDTDMAGVDWILAENWWPYQRPSFVTPPFAGYVSGHSVFSRAAAEVMTYLTGDEYFPGGMGEFHAAKNEFLVFEEGPSVDVTLQWATYRDASDQTSLSRIWGGIHPPVDDVPGRLIGIEIGQDAFEKAKAYFSGVTALPELVGESTFSIYPNPSTGTIAISVPCHEIYVTNAVGYTKAYSVDDGVVDLGGVASGLYVVRLSNHGQAQMLIIE